MMFREDLANDFYSRSCLFNPCVHALAHIHKSIDKIFQRDAFHWSTPLCGATMIRRVDFQQ
jgi:hypothetical protein